MMNYPCNFCANTMIQGKTYTFPRQQKSDEPSCGKVYSNYGLGAAANLGISQQTLVECYRCKGTGWVEERRLLQRRKIHERRMTPNARGEAPPEAVASSALLGHAWGD
jgi:hypothetical protein